MIGVYQFSGIDSYTENMGRDYLTGAVSMYTQTGSNSQIFTVGVGKVEELYVFFAANHTALLGQVAILKQPINFLS